MGIGLIEISRRLSHDGGEDHIGARAVNIPHEQAELRWPGMKIQIVLPHHFAMPLAQQFVHDPI
jgi:hypothetical protein